MVLMMMMMSLIGFDAQLMQLRLEQGPWKGIMDQWRSLGTFRVSFFWEFYRECERILIKVLPRHLKRNEMT